MRTFVAIYLVVGFLIGFGLFGWAAISSVRRHGVSNAARGAARAYAKELALYWRVPVAAWTYLIGAPLVAVWAIVSGDFDLVGAILVVLLWLGYFVLLRWHMRAKAQAQDADALDAPRRPLRIE